MSLDGLAGIDVEATGADSLVLSRVIVGPVPLRFLPPERFTDEATGQPGNLLRIGWDQPWPALESAPTILGPWRPIATDGTEIIVPVPGGVPSQFYRLRE